MNIGEVKQFLYDLAAIYHPGATVAWSKTGGAKPKSPFLSLTYRNLERSLFPVTNDEGNSCYNYSMIFEINLYTNGKEVKAGDETYYENTAVEDLDEFVRFLDSPKITDIASEKGVTIVLNPPIRDVSGLIGDTKFNYRSMAELAVTFMDEAPGGYGVHNKTVVPNPSGGGTLGYAGAVIEPIESVAVEAGTGEE